MKKFLISLILLLSLNTFAGTAYYIANGGNDSDPGTQAQPWASTSKVNTVFASKAAGDSFLFQRGDLFQGFLIISRSGAAGTPMYIGAYGNGANPIITGMSSIVAWTNLGSNIWQSTFAVSSMNDMQIVTVNGVVIPMGRTPNTGWYIVSSATPTNPSQTPPWTLSSTSIDSTAIDWTGADLVTKVWNFSITRNAIYRDSANKLFFTPNTLENWPRATSGFFIENDARTLDTQNEWYFDPSVDKIKMYSVGAPSGVQVSIYDTLVYMNTKNHVKFEDIDFIGSNRRTFYITSSDSIHIHHCNLDLNGLYAVWGGTNGGNSSLDFTMDSCNVYRCGSQGITLASEFSNVYMGHDTIINTGLSYGSFKVPVFDNGQNSHWNGAFGSITLNNVIGATIEYCYIDSSGYAGIWLNSGNLSVHHNEVLHCVNKLMDNAGIYNQGIRSTTNFTANRIHHNHSHDNYGDSSGVPVQSGPKLASGIYLDENTWDTQVDSNTVYSNSLYGIFSNSNTDCRFRFNKSFDNGAAPAYFSSNFRGIRTMTGIGGYQERETGDTLENNTFVAKTGTTFSQQFAVRFSSHNQTMDSMFNVMSGNVYTRPIDENTTNNAPIELDFSNANIGGGTTFFHYTLTQYKGYVDTAMHFNSVTRDQDAARSPVTPISLTSDLIIKANTSMSPQTYTLPFTYQSISTHAFYNGFRTLQPFESDILVKFGPLTNSNFIIIYGNNKIQ